MSTGDTTTGSGTLTVGFPVFELVGNSSVIVLQP
jgi:hypothetical protein